jgi:hypothetical protein
MFILAQILRSQSSVESAESVGKQTYEAGRTVELNCDVGSDYDASNLQWRRENAVS